MPKVNKKLLREVMDYVSELPELTDEDGDYDLKGEYWCQASFGHYLEDETGEHCGTAACIAGWTCLLSTKHKVLPTRSEFIRLKATRLLGLDEEQAFELFYSNNSISRLQEIVADLIDEA